MGGMSMIDPARHVAVFGDAPNDVSMFRCVRTRNTEVFPKGLDDPWSQNCSTHPGTNTGSQGERCSRAALRVAMPHADCEELLELRVGLHYVMDVMYRFVKWVTSSYGRIARAKAL